MIFLNLFFVSIFSLANFSVQENEFNLASKHCYYQYKEDGDEIRYNERFIDNLYNNDYITGETMITVFTHGMYGNRDHWFPKDLSGNSLYYDMDSLAYKIANTSLINVSNIPILTFKMNDDEDGITFEQLSLIDGEYRFVKLTNPSALKLKQLFKQHVILIYESKTNVDSAGASNSEVAREFKKCLDSALARISIFYKGMIPKINLIGHSRGGITNLYYAYKRMKLVDNFITIGSPLNGSTWADVLNSYYFLAQEFTDAEEPEEDYSGMLGFQNSIKNTNMLSHLIGPYKVAFGCEMTPVEFCQELLSYILHVDLPHVNDVIFEGDNIVVDLLNIILDWLENGSFVLNSIVELTNIVKAFCQGLNNALEGANKLNEIKNQFLSLINVNNNDKLGRIIEKTQDLMSSTMTLCDDIANYNTTTNCIKGDVCVDLDSQFCRKLGGTHFDREVLISFGKEPYTDFDDKFLSNPQQPKVAHNYECNNPQITDEIVAVLVQRDSLHSHNFDDVTGQCECGFNNTENFIINPSQIPCYYLSEETLNECYPPDIYYDGIDLSLREKYYFESEINTQDESFVVSNSINDFVIRTKRLRTGYIRNEKLTLSANRENAGFAYIEFYFERAIYNFTFDVSLWSDDESVSTSNLKFVYSSDPTFYEFLYGYAYETYCDDLNLNSLTLKGQNALLSNPEVFGRYYDEIPINTLPTDRDCPISCTIRGNGMRYLGFYVACNPTTSTKNKGRICLSNFNFHICEVPSIL